MTRLGLLRQAMAEFELDAYIITSADAHASEYTASFWRGREWVSGFTGSAGLLVVTAKHAGLWTDGRYFVQAERELQGSGIELFREREPGVPEYTEFLAEELPVNGKLGFDGRTVMAADFSKIQTALAAKNISFLYDVDLLTGIWHDRPALPAEPAFLHPLQFAGASSAEKLEAVREKMREKDITALLITTLESTAWLANLRGGDVANTPVAYAFSLVTPTEAHIFIGPKKLDMLPGFQIHEYDALPAFLQSAGKVHFNPRCTNVLLAEGISDKAELKAADDIVANMKAAKTPAELAHIRNAYLREGVVFVKMLAWLEGEITRGAKLCEADIARFLLETRKCDPLYICDSFDAICAYGANAAQPHYSCDRLGAHLEPRGFLLIDSGGQYHDGTTDTTRTVALGGITDEMRRDFTLVLKGNLALGGAVFPRGTPGHALDTLARQPLWAEGRDYSHGTGHGVGYCLGVHEGPQRIAKVPSPAALVPGMLISNEPGIYVENSHGIRTENILAVIEAENLPNFLAFETLTLTPLDTRALDPAMLTPSERDSLNAYHKRVREALTPHLEPHEREWLERATRDV